MMYARLRSNWDTERISSFEPSLSVKTMSPAAPPYLRSHFTSYTSRQRICTTSLPWNPEATSMRRLVILYRVHAWRASDAVNGITPTTVKSERPGIRVSVIDGGPSKKVCSGAIRVDVAGPLTFSLGSFDFFGRALAIGSGLYAARIAAGATRAGMEARAAERGVVAAPERANEAAPESVHVATRKSFIRCG